MPSVRIDQTQKDQIYFVTFTVKNWYYLFDRHNRFQILCDAFLYAQAQKGLKLHAYVLMLNHLHFIGYAPDMPGIIRDFKRHTTKELLSNIREFEPNIEQLFLEEDRMSHSIWQPSNMPIPLVTEKVLEQKINYVHHNPVRKQYVREPEHWLWSSANPDSRISVDDIEI